jgi:hypothetical protein
MRGKHPANASLQADKHIKKQSKTPSPSSSSRQLNLALLVQQHPNIGRSERRFIGCTSDLIRDFSLSSPSAEIGLYDAIFSSVSVADGITNGFNQSVSYV